MRIFVLCIAFWLPVQTMAGVVMPLGEHALEQNVPVIGDERDGSAIHCHDAMDVESTATPHDSACNDCGVCHLASTGFMVCSPLTLNADTVSGRHSNSVVAAPPNHITEPPQHPPRPHA